MADAPGMSSPAEKLIRFTGRRRKWCLGIAAVLGVLAALGVLRGDFTNDVSQLFPETPESSAMFRVLRKAHLADTVQLEFIAPAGIAGCEEWLDRTVSRIAALPDVNGVTFRYRSAEAAFDLSALSRLTPRFNPPDILRECIPEEAVRRTLAQLAFPLPGGARRLGELPFRGETRLLMKLRELDRLTGMRLAPDLPYFATADKTRAMIVFDADVPVGDADAVRRLYSKIAQCVGTPPDGVRWRIISGSSHTLGNEETLKRDATISGLVSLGLFLAVFVFFYRRDWRSLWIPALPVYSSLLALGLMTLFFKEICWYVIGLGSCITGLAVDQGIHVYAAFHGDNAEHKAAALAKPMALSAATSIAVFLILALSGIRAYIQLAAFAGTSLALSCLIALTLLPHLIRRDHAVREFRLPAPRVGRSGGIVLLILSVMAAFGAVYGGVKIAANADFSLRALDGTPERVLREEAEFNAAWRSAAPRTAILAALGENAEAALERLGKTAALLESRGVRTASTPRPPISEQRKNLEKWRTPETRRQIDDLERRTRRACAEKNLPEGFFTAYFDNLRSAIDSEELTLPPLLENIDRRMVRERRDGAAATALLQDTPENVRAVRGILAENPDDNRALLSAEGFRALVRDELGGRFKWIMPLALFSALLLSFLVFRNLRDVLRAMIPVAAAFSALAILGGISGFRATPAAAFAMILLTGLAVDYGIYAVCQMRAPENLSVGTPIILSAATTVAGAGALLFSRHPALFDTGVVLSVGITVACLGGLFLVPLTGVRMPSGKMLAAFAAAVFALSGCTASGGFPADPEAGELRRKTDIYPTSPFALQALATVGSGEREFSFLLAAEIDPDTGKIKAAGVNTGSGVSMFRTDGMTVSTFAAASPELARFFRAVPEDLQRIFVHKNRRPLAVERKTEYIAVYSDDGVEIRLYEWGTELRKGKFPLRRWRCEYRDSGRTLEYRNYDGGYRLRLKIIKLCQLEK